MQGLEKIFNLQTEFNVDRGVHQVKLLLPIMHTPSSFTQAQWSPGQSQPNKDAMPNATLPPW